ncbi:MAG TPA: polymorphic toxin-type HINT domain-containing protein [Candidatus Dormibacteraeota bacterium]
MSLAGLTITAGYAGHGGSRALAGHRALAAKLVALVLLLTAMDLSALVLQARAPGHQPTPAPVQAWGSAAGQPHVVGKPADLPVPQTLRGQYPLRPDVPAPVAPRNAAWTAAAPAPAVPVSGFDPATSRELPQRQGAYDRTWANADGTLTTALSSSPVNRRLPDGRWAPMDTTLVPAGGAAGWRSAATAIDVRLAADAGAPELARLALDKGHAIAFGLAGAAAATGQVEGSTITYPDVWPGVDVRLEVVGAGVKETLVLRSPAAATSFVFPLRLTGLRARVAGGQVDLVDAGGRTRAVVPAGSMADATGAQAGSGAVSYSLARSDAGPALRMSLDPGWLTDPARQYPVLIDPTVLSGSADSSLVAHGSASASGSSELLVGQVDGSPAASYIRFGGLVGQLTNHTIYGAELQLVDFDAPSCSARPVTVNPVTQSWSSSSTTTAYPGPSVGAALGRSSFAYGFVALGHSSSACPVKASLIDLGGAGVRLVQGWANGQANNGLSLRASTSDSLAWKRFAGTGTANSPVLYVTHSPYNATYRIPNPVPNPPVLQNQAGKVNVTVTNQGAETWTPATYYLAYRAYDAVTGHAVTQQRSANLTANLARGARVTLSATIQALPAGKYFLDFTMVHTGGPVFTDEQVPPARIVLQVIDIPPVVQSVYPPNGYEAQTLTPQLWAQAVDIDATAGSSLQYRFELCDQDASGNAVNCTSTPEQLSPAWTIPAGRLSWSKTYLWRAFVKDATTEVASPQSALLSSVPQPELSSHLAGAPYGTQGKEFDPQVGNFSTVAIDAPVTTVGPDLTVVRTYNSLDPRRDSSFGAGWTTRYDVRLVPDNDGSGNVVVAYPDGQRVRFGRNPDGTYAAPRGRVAALTLDSSSSTWTLADKAGTTYRFASSGLLTRIADASGRAVVLTYDTSNGRLARAQVSNSQSNTAGRSLTFTWTGAHVTSVTTDPVNGTALTWSYTYSGDVLTKVCAPGAICTTYTYATGTHYRSVVLDDRPDSYWRLGEAEGTAAGSEVAVNLGKDHGDYHSVTLGATGALAGSGDTAASFNGTSSYLDLPKGTVKKSRDMAVELWFKNNPAGPGGPLLGYQDKAVGQTATIGVPVLYTGTDGKLYGQLWNGTAGPMASTALVNDGKWHHVVLSQMGATQTLYLDGKSIGTLANPASTDVTKLTVNQVGAAFASSPSSWPAWGTTSQRFYNGAIDEVAVYSHPLAAAEVAAHLQYGTQAADQVTTVTLPGGGAAAQVTYDTAQDRVSQYTDRNGGTWKMGTPTVYGGDTDLRRGVEVRDPAGRPHLYEYDALAGRMIRSGDPSGLVMRDEDNPVAATPTPTPSPTPTTSCTSPDPTDPQFCTTVPTTSGGPVFDGHSADGIAIRTYAYDAQGNLSVTTDENGDSVRLGYDGQGNVASRQTCRSSSECHTEYYTYPTALSQLDPRSDLPTQHRDGRSASATDNTYLTTYTYTAAGDLLTQANPDGSTVRHVYTNGTEAAAGGGTVPSGLLLTTTDAVGAVTHYAYLQNGDLAQVTDPSGLVTKLGYDALGRKASQTAVSDTFPNGVTTTYTYDALSHLLTTTEPATTDAVTGTTHQGRTTNTYDADGNLVRVDVSDVTGHDATRTTTYAYDDHGRVERVTNAEGNETSYGHDAFGNRTSMVDAAGNRYEFGYTARNMLAEVRLRNWTGDPAGAAPASAGDWLVVESYTYDMAGRALRHTDAMGRTRQYAYYGDGLVQSVTLKGFHNPDGTTRDFVEQSDTYDGAGNLVTQVTGNGTRVAQHTIGLAGQVSSTVVDPGGLSRRTDFTYDANGNVTRTTTSGMSSNVPWPVAATSATVDFAYDTSGRLVRETQTSGTTSLVTTHAYDQRGLLMGTTDPRGNAAGADPTAYTTSYTYDELGRLTRTTDPPMAVESGGGAPSTTRPAEVVGLNTFDDQVAVQDSLGNVTRTGVDTLGRPVTTTAPAYTPPGGSQLTPTTQTTYDVLGNVATVTDALGHVTRYAYDQLGRMVSKDEPASTDSDRAVWQYTYTRTGRVLSVTDPTGARAESTYDDLDRAVTATQIERQPAADSFTTRSAYDDAGGVVSVTQPSGAATSSTYDAVGEQIKTTDPAGVVNQYGYDFAGRQVRSADGLGRTARTDFDVLGHLVAQSALAPGGQTLRTQTYAYDAAGNLTASVDALGHATTYVYDAGRQLVQQVEPVSDTASITTGFGYDAAGHRTRSTDGRGNSTIYTFNSVGRPESVIEPATAAQPAAADRTWTASYDADGNPVKLTAPGGSARQRTFDAAGRLTRETGSGAESSTADRVMAYDAAGRITSVSAPGGTDTYAYDDRGQALTAGGPSGTASFAYDADGNLTSRTDAAGTALYTYVNGRLATATDGITGTTQTVGYDPAGDVSSIAYGAGRVRTYGHDDLGRVSSDTLTNGAGQTVASIAYGYDVNDQLTSKTTAGTAGAGSSAYTYDQASRLTSWTAGGQTTQYAWDASGNRIQAGSQTATYDQRNRLLTAGDTTYKYTPRGTLASTTSAGLTESFSFDAFDRLISQGAQSYAYDGLDRLASRNGTAFSYAGQNDQVVSDGTAKYARGPADELMAVAQGQSQRLAMTDEHGDVVGGFDPANTSLSALQGSTAYDPFGHVTASAGQQANVGYESNWTDPSTGQVDMGARWYDTASGTFDSRDTATYSPGGGASILGNHYTYGAGDPMGNMDPSGDWPCFSCAFKRAAGWVNHNVIQPIYHNVVLPIYHYWILPIYYHVVLPIYHHVILPIYQHVILPVAQTVTQWVGTATQWVGSATQTVTNWVSSGVTWARQQAERARQAAERARQAAIALAHHVTAVAKQAIAWAAKHNPLPAIKAALRPIYHGLKTVVSASAHVAAAVVAVARDVVRDTVKAAQVIYQHAVQAAGAVVQTVSTAVRAASEFAQAALPTLAGIAAGVLTTAGCLAATAGAGSAACIVAGFAVGGAVTNALSCPPGHSIAGCAVQGGVTGAVGGAVFVATGGAGAGLTAALVSGGLSQAASDATGQLMTSGSINPTQVVEQGAMGAATAGLFHGAGSLAAGLRSADGDLGAICTANSFAPGTMVLLADGRHKRIEDVQPGDEVLATDPTTGRTEARPVTDVIVGQGQKQLVSIGIASGSGGGGGTIVATSGHPFWLPERHRWADAGDLRPGDLLQTAEGASARVSAVQAWSQTARVFNLTVDGIHTFYVAAGAGDVLVHNCAAPAPRGVFQRAGDRLASAGAIASDYVNPVIDFKSGQRLYGSPYGFAQRMAARYISSPTRVASSQLQPSGLSAAETALRVLLHLHGGGA